MKKCILIYLFVFLIYLFLIGCEDKPQPVIIHTNSGPGNCVTMIVTGIGRCVPDPSRCQLNGILCETVWNYNTMTLSCNPSYGQQRQVCN